MQKNTKNKVLIVDDIPENIELLESILEMENLEICKAKNGKEALKKVESCSPDLILLDIAMPDMDGFEVCKLLKEHHKNRLIPIIFLTAQIGSEDIVKGLQAGAVDYIVKPYNIDELLSRVRTHLNLKIARDTITLQNQQLQEFNYQRSKFIALMAQNVKKPFEVLFHNSEDLKQKLDSYTSLQIKDKVAIINESAKKVHKLLDNFVIWTKIHTNELNYHPIDVNINSLIDNVIVALRPFANQKEVLLYKTSVKDIFVFTDVNLLASVLRNLITNALNFTNSGGEVVINVEEVRYLNPTATEKGDFVKVTISDTGIGIDEDSLNHLFFWDIDKKNNTIDWELLLCKEYVERWSGSLWAKSTVNKGSEFCFTLHKTQKSNVTAYI